MYCYCSGKKTQKIDVKHIDTRYKFNSWENVREYNSN